jgi:hypothetical protein
MRQLGYPVLHEERVENSVGEYIIHTLYGECPAVAPSVSAAKSKDIAHSKFVESQGATANSLVE